MYWNIVKKEVKTNHYIKVVKSFLCYGLNDFYMKSKAERYCSWRNLIRRFSNKYYYTIEFYSK